MKVIAIIFVFTSVIGLNYAQRGSYAGSRPITNGIKAPFPEETLSNRFNDNGIGQNGINQNGQNQNVVPLPQHFPLNLEHNQFLVNRVNQLPAQQQPFWFLNREHISDHLNGPQNTFGGSVGPQNTFGGSVLANRGSFMGRRRR